MAVAFLRWYFPFCVAIRLKKPGFSLHPGLFGKGGGFFAGFFKKEITNLAILYICSV
jgi:hypothetical protein